MWVEFRGLRASYEVFIRVLEWFYETGLQRLVRVVGDRLQGNQNRLRERLAFRM